MTATAMTAINLMIGALIIGFFLRPEEELICRLQEHNLLDATCDGVLLWELACKQATFVGHQAI